MSIKKSASEVFEILDRVVEKKESDLNYQNIFELLVAVILSAQTTDFRVNQVTPNLFKTYPDVVALATAKTKDVEEIISSLGLFRNKARSIVDMSKMLISNFNGNVPSNINELLTLPGVGKKTANVVLSEGFKKPAIAVDTHVARVSKRLGLTQSTDVLVIEKDLQIYFPKKKWGQAHILLVHFGRYICMAKKPLCDKCLFQDDCTYYSQIKTK